MSATIPAVIFLVCLVAAAISINKLVYLLFSGDALTHFCYLHSYKRQDPAAFERWYRNKKILYACVAVVSCIGVLGALPSLLLLI